MKFASFGDVEIAYLDEAANLDQDKGHPVLLIHGFASKASVNWVYPGWVKALTSAGYRVIALDNRGHGKSTKFHDPARYEPDLMAADAINLLDHLEIKKAHIIGYSMGSRLMTFLTLAAPERAGRLVFGGMGDHLVKGVGRWEPIAQALEADSLDDVDDETGRKFRAFADQTGSDRLALAACIRPSRQKISEEQLSKLDHPALVVVGTDDDVAGSGGNLANMLKNGRSFPLPGRDHMKAVGDKNFKQAVLEFFAEDLGN